MKYASFLTSIIMCCLLSLSAKERTLLLGPKTIGPGWKDNIIVNASQFQQVNEGDIITLYTANAKRTAQGAFQDPQNWQAVAPAYGYFSVSSPVRMKVTGDILAIIKSRGLCIGGHDYQIIRLTHIPADEMVEKFIYKGPSVKMMPDWSAYANLQKKIFKDVKVGDGIRFHISKVEDGACIKLTDFTYNTMDPAVDGAPVSGDSFTYYIDEQSQLIKLTLASSEGISMRVTGKGYTLNKISQISCISEEDSDLSTAQRAPKEYKLSPGELFRGEKEFPTDWSGNLRLTAQPFQEFTLTDCIVVSYTLLPEEQLGNPPPQLSFRENGGKWKDITGSDEPVWYPLTGDDIVYTLDDTALDKLKTTGIVITGMGAVITKVSILHIE